jgi:hypothetical protein
MLFIENERSATAWRSRWQDRLYGVWGRIAGGCHLNRRPLKMICDAGFVISSHEQDRFPLHLWQLGSQSAGEAFRG